MGRPGVTKKLRDAVRKEGIDLDEGFFIIGPELADISSTAVREALQAGDSRMLERLLHPRVAEWCSSNGPYRPQRSLIPEREPRDMTLSQALALLSSQKDAAAKDAERVAKVRADAEDARQIGARLLAKQEASARRKMAPTAETDALPGAVPGAETDELICQAWSAVLGCGADPPPLPRAELREQLRVHLISAGTSELPTGSALRAVDELLQLELRQRSLASSTDAQRSPEDARLALWKGDITALRIGAIVDAANERGLGCFRPEHRCIDNAIHCRAGPALRAACHEELRSRQGHLPTGEAMVTPAFNLPCEYVIHVPGPQCSGEEKPELLAACYSNTLEACKAKGIRSVAFCCISTGLFGYPAKQAAGVAVSTVKAWLDRNPGCVDLVVFNVFLCSDSEIYAKVLNLESAEGHQRQAPAA